ncbi:hypothetical protein Pcinc_022183 [Petrolisthes cinctipes]|uniref:Uncharacterized protein n=1 Tax=Petrolisthes cinctipes TaxID=88211 RepID=A0AAE1FI97_PETCI|nr:hypothetical protein Pcinc_022183 [Petrolisthes cinctipes]
MGSQTTPPPLCHLHHGLLHYQRPDIDSIGPEDADKFRNIALICCGVGAVFSFIFHIGVQEPPYVPHSKKQEAIAVQEKSQRRCGV